MIARHFYRPINAGILQQHAAVLPHIQLFPITSFTGGWEEAQQKFFAEGGVFDSIYQTKAQ